MNYRDEMVQRIKEAGQELIDRAESMISSETDLITDFDIYINLSRCDEVPSIQYNTTVGNKRSIKRMSKSDE